MNILYKNFSGIPRDKIMEDLLIIVIRTENLIKSRLEPKFNNSTQSFEPTNMINFGYMRWKNYSPMSPPFLWDIYWIIPPFLRYKSTKRRRFLLKKYSFHSKRDFIYPFFYFFTFSKRWSYLERIYSTNHFVRQSI